MITNGMVAFSGLLPGNWHQAQQHANVPKTHVLDHFAFEDGKDNLNNPGNRSKKYRSVSFLDPSYFDTQ